MAAVLYADFLNDPEEYTRAESFWKQRWEQLMEEVGQGGSWRTPWFNTTFVNGTPFRDGNPIFSAVCPDRPRKKSVSTPVVATEPLRMPYSEAKVARSCSDTAIT